MNEANVPEMLPVVYFPRYMAKAGWAYASNAVFVAFFVCSMERAVRWRCLTVQVASAFERFFCCTEIHVSHKRLFSEARRLEITKSGT